MITAIPPHNFYTDASKKLDCSLGNNLFTIAGVIGIAEKNGYEYGFNGWANQKYFVNQLPVLNKPISKPFQMPVNYKGFDLGFRGFDVPDNVQVNGYLGSYKYFEHCFDLIRHYFEMEELCSPLKDCILVHCRDYAKFPEFYKLGHEYYKEALERLPKKDIVVVTDNIEYARKVIDLDCGYTCNPPIIDFYLLAHADYLVMANSSFSWWGAFLSQAKTIAPKIWFDPQGGFADCPIKIEDVYCKEWEII